MGKLIGGESCNYHPSFYKLIHMCKKLQGKFWTVCWWKKKKPAVILRQNSGFVNLLGTQSMLLSERQWEEREDFNWIALEYTFFVILFCACLNKAKKTVCFGSGSISHATQAILWYCLSLLCSGFFLTGGLTRLLSVKFNCKIFFLATYYEAFFWRTHVWFSLCPIYVFCWVHSHHRAPISVVSNIPASYCVIFGHV